jgi:predicted dehydrogenase
MTQSLRVGVIGVGHLGRHHARIYNELPLVSLAGVVDTNISTGNTIGKE